MNLFPYILKSSTKEAYRFRIFTNLLGVYQEKTPLQNFLASLAVNGNAKFQPSPTLISDSTNLLKVLHIYRYIIVATIYFSGKTFPKQYHALGKVLTDAKNSKFQIQHFQIFT